MKFAIPGYAQEVRHLEHGEVPKQIDCGVCAFDNETKVVKAAFKIVNETVTPDEPFGESGEPATLTALAELRVENPEEYSITWTVDILDPDGNLVSGYGDPEQAHLAQDGGEDVEAVWDGKVNGEFVESPLEYSFWIRANAESQVAGRQPFEDELVVELNPPALLKVFGSEAEIANSSDTAELGPDADEETLAGFQRLGTVNSREVWTIEVHGRLGTTEPLNGFATSAVSNPGVPFPLTVTYNTEEKLYKVEFDPSTVLKTGQELGNTLITTGAGAALLDESTGDAVIRSHGFAELLRDVLESVTQYPAPKKLLGRFVYTDLPQRIGNGDRFVAVAPDEAHFTPENLKKLGFEAVTITVLTPKGPLVAVVKVENPASVLGTLTHGGFDGNLNLGNLSGGGQATLAPEELGDVSNLQTWVLSSCNVLIAYDYNNNVVGLPGRTGPDDPLGVRQAQGHRWWQKLNRGGTVLLGYNYPVYSDRASLALVEFRRLVNDPGFSVPNVAISSQNKQQWAWMVANAKVGGEAWNACAWDSEFYYYLPKYDRMKDPFLDESSRVQDPRYSLFGILRVALDERGLPLAEPQAIQLPPDSPSSHPGAVQQFKIP